ncbi:MAG: beta-galactosidase [Candidatus Hydrogenedentes bacterium]|nr:beta-galactosidase [Candidatus Hydrogenedentota bacterium]
MMAASLLLFVYALNAHALQLPLLGIGGEKEDPRDTAFAGAALTPAAEGVVWGRPLDAGPIRVLFLAPRFTMRDASELLRRLDVELIPVSLWSDTQLGQPENSGPAVAGCSAQETLSRLHDALQRRIDVIVAADFDFHALPQEDFAALTEKVRTGTGLLLANHQYDAPEHVMQFLNALTPAEDGDYVTRGVGESLSPEWRKGLDFVVLEHHGEGRVVELDYSGGRPLSHCLLPVLENPTLAEPEHLDTYLSLIARAVRWLAKREPAVAVESITALAPAAPNEAEIPLNIADEPAQVPQMTARSQYFRPYELRLRKPAERDYLVRSQLRQPGRAHPFEIIYKAILHKGESTYRLYAPATSGKFYMDVWLLDGEKVVEWHTEAIEVEGRPFIIKARVSKPLVQTQDTLGVEVALLSSPRPCTIHVRAIDSLGRLVARATETIDTGVTVAQVALSLSDLLTTSLKIEAYAVDRETSEVGDWDLRQAAFACEYVPVRLPIDPGDFAWGVVEDGSAEYNKRYAYRTLTELGVTYVDTIGNEVATGVLGRAGLRSFARVTQYLPDSPAIDLVRQPCLNDPRFVQSDTDSLTSMATALRTQGLAGYSIGSRNTLTKNDEDVCHSPECVEAYWNRLQQTYGGLEHVNARWATSYPDWDSVRPPLRDAAATSGNYAPWVDFRASMNAVFEDTHARARKTLRNVDPRAWVGFRAYPNASALQGYDWGRLTPAMDWMTVDPDPVSVERVRSFKRKDASAGMVLDYGAHENDAVWQRWEPWYAVLHGFGTVWYPGALGSSAYANRNVLLSPDGNPLPSPSPALPEIEAIQGGISSLVAQAERMNSGIALFDDAASEILSYVEGESSGHSQDELLAFMELIHGLGYQFDLVNDEQIANGALSAYRVLVLPKARALSNKTVEAIAQFHQQGGSLIAGYAPGVYDEHGLVRAGNPLPALFGAAISKPGTWTPPSNGEASVSLDEKTFNANLEGAIAETGLQAQEGITPGGTAGETPVWFVRRGEQGVAALLNHSVIPWQAKPAGGDALLRALLRAGGAEPVAEFAKKGTRLFRGEVVGYRLGNVRIYGVIARPDAGEQKLQMKLDDPGAVFNVRTGTRVVRPKSMTMSLGAGMSEVYASLPYDVTGLDLEMPKSMVLGERFPMVFKVNARKETPRVHVIHVELRFVQGDQETLLRHYTKDVVCAEGTGNAFIPFALNELPGVYKLTARDVLSGKTAETIIQVLKTGEVINGPANLM